jgi:Uma2 family endonuclease
MLLGVDDLVQMQRAFPDLKMELVGGKVIVMSPSDIWSSAVGTRLIVRLGPYVEQHRLGTVTDAEGGYRLPNGDLRAPDVSFVSYERLRTLPHGFPRAVPEFAAEIRSATDSTREVREKLAAFLAAGVRVGLYVDPRAHEVVVMRPERDDETLGDGDVLRIPELFPGWEVAVRDLWPPEPPER